MIYEMRTYTIQPAEAWMLKQVQHDIIKECLASFPESLAILGESTCVAPWIALELLRNSGDDTARRD